MLVTSLLIACDDNDAYLIEYSSNGIDFANAFEFVASDGPQTGGIDILTTNPSFPFSPTDNTTPAFVGREFTAINARFLRVSSTAGDDAKSIGEFQAFTTVFAAGDFDMDGDVDTDDIDFYAGNLDLPASGDLAQLDLDGDGFVTLADHDLHVTTLAETSNGQTGALLGDTNLDGSVDVLNDAFALVGGLGTSTGGYANGDLNADEAVSYTHLTLPTILLV